MSSDRFYKEFLDSKYLRVLGWLCFIVAGMRLLTILLTIITGPPEWNRADYFLDTGVWAYVGMLHMALAKMLEEVSEDRAKRKND